MLLLHREGWTVVQQSNEWGAYIEKIFALSTHTWQCASLALWRVSSGRWWAVWGVTSFKVSHFGVSHFIEMLLFE